ncbi:MAG TPA: sodium-independent anion transporter, partial [Alcaligenes faecalis]|nr:sodium-independent anion transporter [Alcaligenes faecalis]
QDISVLTLEGPYFFASVEAVNRSLLTVPEQVRAVVLRLNYVPFVDATAMQALETALAELEQRNVMVALCEANEKVGRKLIRMGLFKQIHAHRVFDSLQNAWESVSETLDHQAVKQKETATPETGMAT